MNDFEKAKKDYYDWKIKAINDCNYFKEFVIYDFKDRYIEELENHNEKMIPYLVQLCNYLLSSETFCFDNEFDYKDGLELQNLLSKITGRPIEEVLKDE